MVAGAVLGPRRHLSHPCQGSLQGVRLSDRGHARSVRHEDVRFCVPGAAGHRRPKRRFDTHGLSLVAGPTRSSALSQSCMADANRSRSSKWMPRRTVPTLTWIGCAVAPDPIGLNSVRGLPDGGGFVATNFLARSGGPDIKTVMAGAKERRGLGVGHRIGMAEGARDGSCGRERRRDVAGRTSARTSRHGARSLFSASRAARVRPSAAKRRSASAWITSAGRATVRSLVAGQGETPAIVHRRQDSTRNAHRSGNPPASRHARVRRSHRCRRSGEGTVGGILSRRSDCDFSVASMKLEPTKGDLGEDLGGPAHSCVVSDADGARRGACDVGRSNCEGAGHRGVGPGARHSPV